jgi:hypothetical protein
MASEKPTRAVILSAKNMGANMSQKNYRTAIPFNDLSWKFQVWY